MSEQLVEREQRVTPVELFFDLVFVYATVCLIRPAVIVRNQLRRGSPKASGAA